MRTHYCGEITESLIGQEITVCGWVHRRRDHGGVIFIDLRDREGLLQVVYDPDKVSYEELLKIFWVNIDPLTAKAQFCDHGSQYRAGIYYLDEKQKQAAFNSLDNIKSKFKQPVVTEIKMASTFYPAEEYHQDYYQNNPIRYKLYRYSCGRDRRLAELWKKA